MMPQLTQTEFQFEDKPPIPNPASGVKTKEEISAFLRDEVLPPIVSGFDYARSYEVALKKKKFPFYLEEVKDDYTRVGPNTGVTLEDDGSLEYLANDVIVDPASTSNVTGGRKKLIPRLSKTLSSAYKSLTRSLRSKAKKPKPQDGSTIDSLLNQTVTTYDNNFDCTKKMNYSDVLSFVETSAARMYGDDYSQEQKDLFVQKNVILDELRYNSFEELKFAVDRKLRELHTAYSEKKCA